MQAAGYKPAPTTDTAPSSTAERKQIRKKAPEVQIRTSPAPFGEGGKQWVPLPKHNPASRAATTCGTVLRSISPAPSPNPGASGGFCMASTPAAAGATAPLGTRGRGKPSPALWGVLASKANLKPSFPADLLFVVLERAFGYKKQSQTPKNNPELLQQGNCILRYAEYYQTRSLLLKLGQG